MKINLNNYEAYFLDYIEGRLDKATLKELQDFLKQNPLLKQELENFEEVTLQPENIPFENKTALYKLEFEKSEINGENYGYFCIAYHEKLLNKEKILEFERFTKTSSNFDKEKIDFGKVYLNPDLSIGYPDKTQLYRRKVVYFPSAKTVILWSGIAAAAIFGIYLYFTTEKKPIIANNQKINQSTTLAQSTGNSVKNENTLVIKTVKKPLIKKLVTSKSLLNEKTEIITAKRENLNLAPISPVNQDLEIASADKLIKKLELLSLDVNRENNSAIEPEENSSEEIKKLNLLALAETGLNGFNKLTGIPIELNHATDKSGKIKSISFYTGIFGFSRKKTK